MESVIRKMDTYSDKLSSSKTFGVIITILIVISVFAYFKLLMYTYDQSIQDILQYHTFGYNYAYQFPFFHKNIIHY